jgi:methylmalonyl-CoA mutase cobalamin-binding subunit
LQVFVDDGVNITDAAQVLLAMRRTTMPDLEERVDFAAPDEIAILEPWKASQIRDVVSRVGSANTPRLDGLRIVLAVLEVHSLVRDALAKALPRFGAEIILLNAATSIDGVMRAALDEDADAIVLATYNGNAIDLGERLIAARHHTGWNGAIYMGGILNQDTGETLPIDARPRLSALNIHCVERVEDLVNLLANQS